MENSIHAGSYIYTNDNNISKIEKIIEDHNELYFYCSNNRVYTLKNILKYKDYLIEIIDEIIDLSSWTTKYTIIEELYLLGFLMNERTFRSEVEEYNNLYANHKVDQYVAHSSKGYILTEDRNIIIDSLKDLRKRGIDQLTKYSKGMKALGENANMTLKIKNNEMYYTEY